MSIYWYENIFYNLVTRSVLFMEASNLLKRIAKSEHEAVKLRKEILLVEGKTPKEFTIGTDDSELKTTNTKLRYQIHHLNKSILEEEAKLMQHATGVLQLLNNVFTVAVRRAYPNVTVKSFVKHTEHPRFGDYQYSAAMAIASSLKSSNRNSNPIEVAKNIVSSMPPCDFISKCEVQGAGFINVHVQPWFVSQLITDILKYGARPPAMQRKRVVVDFSSPNIAKEMHVGHLRSTIIGESICRLLEYGGHDVLRLNHVGDWGTQFGQLIAHITETCPDFSTTSLPVEELQVLYKQAQERFKSDDSFKETARGYVVKLQNGEPDVIEAWRKICDVSRKGFEKIYRKLGVTLTERGESFYQSMMSETVQDLESKGLLKEDQGSRVVFVPGYELPLMLVKSDGAFTYDTSDMTALKHRVMEEKGDWLVYVVDSGQGTHFQLIFAAAKMAGYYDPEQVRVDHVGFGVVLGADKKRLKTRSGDSVKLKDLLEEGLERSMAKLIEKERDKVLTQEELQKAQEALAYGCVKYADLMHNRINDYVFSFDKMLEDRGNTAVYLLYSLTRIRSIIRTAQITDEELTKAANETKLSLAHEKELKLAKCVIRHPEIIEHVLDDLCPHTICEYAYELCVTFSEFYDNCYCIEKKPGSEEIIAVHMDRILLCKATATILENCLHIIGLETVSKM